VADHFQYLSKIDCVQVAHLCECFMDDRQHLSTCPMYETYDRLKELGKKIIGVDRGSEWTSTSQAFDVDLACVLAFITEELMVAAA
jgi:hypothetical protein